MKRKFKGMRAVDFSGMYAPATVVLFAGLGGVCIGVEQAYVEAGHPDRYVDLAVNHWTTAVAVHEANHPMTEHLRADVWEVDPAKVLPGRKIAYLHASPDCTDFSKAKGSAPKCKHIRSLADVVLVWAGKRRPDVITLENVEEFRQWGPLLDNGQPDPARRGEEFQRWCRELRELGYTVDHREMRACDYGTPTTRKRLFVVARCDGKPIVWPEKTHGKETASGSGNSDPATVRRTGISRDTGTVVHDGFIGRRWSSESPSAADAESHQKGRRRNGGDDSEVLPNDGKRSCAPRLKPYLTAASCIDWSIPMLSIFASPEEAKAFGKQHGVGTPRRPLKPKTLARIAGGLDKFVLKAAKPFLVRVAHGDNSAGGPRWGQSSHSVDQPLGTMAGSKDFAVVDATLSPFTAGVGGRAGQSPETAVDRPMPTVTGKADRVVVAATLSRDFGNSAGADIDSPAPTATGCNHTAVVGATLAPYTVPNLGERDGQSPRSGSINAPLPTVTGTASGASLVAATLTTLNHAGPEHRGASPAEPLATVTGANDARALVAALVTKHYSDSGQRPGLSPDEPLSTVTGCDHHALTTAHLVKFRGDSKGTAADEPMPTITSGAGSARDAGAAHALGVSVAYLSHFYTSNTNGGEGDPLQPAKTVTSGGQHSAVTVAICKEIEHEKERLRKADQDRNPDGEPLFQLKPEVEQPRRGRDRHRKGELEIKNEGTVGAVERGAFRTSEGAALSAVDSRVTAPSDRREIVAAFIAAYYGQGSGKTGHSVADPMPTVVSHERFGLVTISIDGQTYVVTDIAMRMLTPRELATAQGFPLDYVIDRTSDGRRVTKADQVKLIGNSVCPQVARAIAKANVVDLRVFEDAGNAGAA